MALELFLRANVLIARANYFAYVAYHSAPFSVHAVYILKVNTVPNQGGHRRERDIRCWKMNLYLEYVLVQSHMYWPLRSIISLGRTRVASLLIILYREAGRCSGRRIGWVMGVFTRESVATFTSEIPMFHMYVLLCQVRQMNSFHVLSLTDYRPVIYISHITYDSTSQNVFPLVRGICLSTAVGDQRGQ